MKPQLENRLKELRTEFESGQKALADLEHQQTNLRSSLLRISGAIQVLEEELSKEGGQENKEQPAGEVHKPEQETELSQAISAFKE
jgi:chromosome segregation ATPase